MKAVESWVWLLRILCVFELFFVQVLASASKLSWSRQRPGKTELSDKTLARKGERMDWILVSLRSAQGYIHADRVVNSFVVDALATCL